MTKEQEQIALALVKTPDITITVAGDYCLDKYLYINPTQDEISVETHLTAYQVHRKALFPGVGGTITNNLRALGAKVNCVGLLGLDGEGYELLAQLQATGANTGWMVSSSKVCTSTYTKPMRKQPSGLYKEMNRFDFRNFTPIPRSLELQFLANLEQSLLVSKSVIIADQFLERNLGVITDFVRDGLAKLAAKYPSKIFYADSRGFSNLYQNMIVKCNHQEVVSAMRPGHSFQEPPSRQLIYACGQELCQRNGYPVLVTQGEKGSLLFTQEGITAVPAFPVIGEIDICGAGDANNAGFVLGLSLGLPMYSAALLGNIVSSLTIQQIGVTGTTTVPQVLKRLQQMPM